MRMRTPLAALSMLVALSACGQTGALYLPEDESSTVVTRPAGATAPAAPSAPETTTAPAAPAKPGEPAAPKDGATKPAPDSLNRR